MTFVLLPRLRQLSRVKTYTVSPSRGGGRGRGTKNSRESSKQIQKPRKEKAEEEVSWGH